MGKRVKIQLIDPATNNVIDADVVTTSDNVLFQDGQTLTEKLKNINNFKIEVISTIPSTRNSNTIYFKI